MKQYLSVLAAALLAASPGLADMIAASPGVTLTEAAQAKFNRDSHHEAGRSRRLPAAPASRRRSTRPRA